MEQKYPNDISPPPNPSTSGLTIYTEKGCGACKQIINFLDENNIHYTNIDCSNYFPYNLDSLLVFINNYIYSYEDYLIKYKNQIVFPIIFKNGKFIGYFTNNDNYFNYIKNNFT